MTEYLDGLITGVVAGAVLLLIALRILAEGFWSDPDTYKDKRED